MTQPVDGPAPVFRRAQGAQTLPVPRQKGGRAPSCAVRKGAVRKRPRRCAVPGSRIEAPRAVTRPAARTRGLRNAAFVAGPGHRPYPPLHGGRPRRRRIRPADAKRPAPAPALSIAARAQKKEKPRKAPCRRPAQLKISQAKLDIGASKSAVLPMHDGRPSVPHRTSATAPSRTHAYRNQPFAVVTCLCMDPRGPRNARTLPVPQEKLDI